MMEGSARGDSVSAGPVLPEGLSSGDIIGIGVEEGTLLLNLSSRALESLEALSPEDARMAVYAMVNTLTLLPETEQVAFFFDGLQVETLSGTLYMYGTFLFNPFFAED